MKRDWTVYIEDEDSLEELEQSLHDLTICCLRLGGIGAIAPHREEKENGDGTRSYQVTKVLFRYDSYAPGKNLPVAAQVIDEPQTDEAEDSEPVAA